MKTSTPLLRTILPSLIPLLVFVAADSFFGERVGLIVGVATGVADFVIAFIRDKKPDFFILADTVFLVAAGLLSLALENDLFFRLKPAAIELLMGLVLGLLLVLPPRYLKNYMERQLRGMSFSEEALAPMRKSLAALLAVLAVHIALTVYAALHLSTAAWGFISGVLLYILFALMILAEFIAARIRNKRYMRAEAERMAAAPYMAARMGAGMAAGSDASGSPGADASAYAAETGSPGGGSQSAAGMAPEGRDLIGVDYYGTPHTGQGPVEVSRQSPGEAPMPEPNPRQPASRAASFSGLSRRLDAEDDEAGAASGSTPSAAPASAPLGATAGRISAEAPASAPLGASAGRISAEAPTSAPLGATAGRISAEAPASAPLGASAPKEEMLPLIDESGRIRGSAPRSLCHNGPGMLHPVVRLEIFDEKGSMYLQKRAMTKTIAPGLWDSAVGGHVRAGESLDAALARELNEELGIALVVLETAGVKPSPLLRFKWETAVESELVFVFATRYKGPFSPDPREIDEGRFWSIKEIDAALGTGVLSQGFEYEYKLLAKMRADETGKKK